MKARVVDVEVVMVLCSATKYFARQKRTGPSDVPAASVRPPSAVQLDGPELRGVSIVGDVELCSVWNLEIQVPRVPVALLWHRLRPPAGPDAEFSVAEPLRSLVSAVSESMWAGMDREQCDAGLAPWDKSALGIATTGAAAAIDLRTLRRVSSGIGMLGKLYLSIVLV